MGLFIEGRDQYTECGITLTSLVVETGTIWASCGLLKKIYSQFSHTHCDICHYPHACFMHAGMQLFKESEGEYTKSKNPLDEILLLY